MCGKQAEIMIALFQRLKIKTKKGGEVQLLEALHRPPISDFLNKYILHRTYVQGTNYWTDRLVIQDDVNGLWIKVPRD